jgi:hypothetical protein
MDCKPHCFLRALVLLSVAAQVAACKGSGHALGVHKRLDSGAVDLARAQDDANAQGETAARSDGPTIDADAGRDTIPFGSDDTATDGAAPDLAAIDGANMGEDSALDADDVGKDGLGNRDAADAAVDSAAMDTGLDGGQALVCTASRALGALPLVDLVTVSPTALAAGDIDGDGKLDLVTAGSNAVKVVFGAGDGTFGTQVDHTVRNAFGIALGDLNRDGLLDVVVANNDDTVTVLLGQGAGKLAPGVVYPVGAAPTSGAVAIALGDLNDDGRLDVVTAFSQTSKVGVLLGTGDGKLGASVEYLTGAEPHALVLGDLNGDGKLDVLTANQIHNVSVLLGSGDGKLGARTDYAVEETTTEYGPRDLAVGDMNGDKKLDVVVAAKRCFLLLGHGDGTLAAANDCPMSQPFSAVAVADFNRDGKLDIAASNGSDSFYSTVGVTLGNGDGSFAAVADYQTDQSPALMAVADLNGDGVADIATANTTNLTLSVLLGKGDGTFPSQAPPRYPVNPAGLRSIAAGDFNGDGRPDLVSLTNDASGAGLLLATGGGTYAAAVDCPMASPPDALAVGDLNGDGRSDLVTLSSSTGSASVLLGKGNGAFEAGVDYPTGPTPLSLAIGDLSGDGKPDVVVAGKSPSTVSVFLGTGNGKLAAKVDYPAGEDPWSVALGDLNGDQKLDVVTANASSNTVSVLLGTGSGKLAAKKDYATGASPGWVALGDVNGDGKLDVVTANMDSYTLSVLLGKGDGTLADKVDYPTDDMPDSLVLGDLNGDGKVDAVASARRTVIVLLGKGDGTFARESHYAVGDGAPLLLDVDGDHKQDLVTAGGYYGDVSVMLNRCP